MLEPKDLHSHFLSHEEEEEDDDDDDCLPACTFSLSLLCADSNDETCKSIAKFMFFISSAL
jgi:hypothetical protein